MEVLPRDDTVLEQERLSPPRSLPSQEFSEGLLAPALDRYWEIYARFVEGKVAPARAPLPEEPGPRVVDIKGGAYFMDASQAGICRIPESAWHMRPSPTTTQT